MNFKLLSGGIFLASFLIGLIVYIAFQKDEIKTNYLKTIPTIPQEISKPKVEIIEQSEIPVNDWQEENDSNFKIKVLESGEGFHGDQISAKNGEIWLGLFKEKNGYVLRSSKIIVQPAHDDMMDRKGEKSGKSVSVNGANQPIFLLKGADNLKKGQIKTVFCNPSDDDLTDLSNGFVANYEINDNKYTLRVEGGANSSKLILESGNTKQILYAVDKMGDATWNLTWVGDLDGDGKLDLYADLTDFYNVTVRRLFLSSQADNGKLVKQAAKFWTNGC